MTYQAVGCVEENKALMPVSPSTMPMYLAVRRTGMAGISDFPETMKTIKWIAIGIGAALLLYFLLRAVKK